MGNIIYYHGGIPALPVQDEGQPTPVSLKGIGHFWGRSVKLFGFGRMGELPWMIRNLWAVFIETCFFSWENDESNQEVAGGCFR